MRVYDLRCEGRTSPINLDLPTPRFSWKPAHATLPVRGARQTAYRVLVASSERKLSADTGDLWDSGKVVSNDTLQIEYAGIALHSATPYHWKVQLWDQDDTAIAWSDPATFATALLSAGEWKAKWIGTESTAALPLFRRQLNIAKPVARAVIYISGLGQFELRCNGRRVSEDVLQPGWTNYHKTVHYVAHDLTSLLKNGDNALGVMLGHGMYHVGDAPAGTKRYTKFKGSFGPPKLIAELHIAYADGSTETIATDETWQTADGPITYSNIYGGEDYDARREPPDFVGATYMSPAMPAAAASPATAAGDIYVAPTNTWSPAVQRDAPAGTLRAASHAAPPIRITQTFNCTLRSTINEHTFVYDSSQNCSMMPQVTVRGPAGSTVKLSPAESLKDDGSVNQKHTGSPVFYTYTLKGVGDETWSPRFSYTGGRYIQAEVAGGATIVAVQSQHITAATDRCSAFDCSSELFNKTTTLIDWAIRSNTVSVLTDCPHREKLGWTEQQHLMGPSLMYAYDLQTIMRKTAADHANAQLPTGDVPTICPQYTQFQPPWDVFNDSPEWGSASVLVPWQTYQWYGDVELLRRQYETMKKYVDYLTSRATDHIVHHGLGDWYDLGPNPPGFAQLTPKELTATAIYYHDAQVLSKVASRVGLADDATLYEALAAKIKAAFIAKFYDAGTHQFATKSQTSLAMPLVLGLLPEADRAAVVENLVADVKAHDTQLTSGDVGYRYLLNALADAGRSDVIAAMNARSDRPGYGMMIAKGETALTEAWDARPQSSLNHFMLGHIQEWLYARLAGLGQVEGSVAFSTIAIAPNPVGGITHAKASYESARGRIDVAWKIQGNTITLDCVIPPNTTAVVTVPTSDAKSIEEAGRSAVSSPGIRQTAEATFTLESGSYLFTAAFFPPVP